LYAAQITECISPFSYNGGAGRLTWANATPESEVHLKLGGDADSGSFKIAFWIANLDKTN